MCPFSRFSKYVPIFTKIHIDYIYICFQISSPLLPICFRIVPNINKNPPINKSSRIKKMNIILIPVFQLTLYGKNGDFYLSFILRQKKFQRSLYNVLEISRNILSDIFSYHRKSIDLCPWTSSFTAQK